MDMIQTLQRQLEEIRLGAVEVKPLIEPVESPKLPNSDLKELLRELIREELGGLGSVSAPPTRELTLLESVELSLTVEEKGLFQNPESIGRVELGLARYFQTSEGKVALRGFLDYYKLNFRG